MIDESEIVITATEIIGSPCFTSLGVNDISHREITVA
jgi:hypothetical protein